MLSVVIPTYNELALGYLEKLLAPLIQLQQLSSNNGETEAEVLFVDGGSSDGTREFLREKGFSVVDIGPSSRAQRLNAGIEKTSGEMLLLHHPRSYLSFDGLHHLLQIHQQKRWGSFTHCFDHSSRLLRWTSWYSNHVRFRRGIIYLDHCIFCHRDLLQGYLIPDVDIFEDTEVCLWLRRTSGTPPLRLPFFSTTSAVRFLTNGPWRQSLTNQWLKISYLMKASPSRMNRFYEKNLELNQSYEKKNFDS